MFFLYFFYFLFCVMKKEAKIRLVRKEELCYGCLSLWQNILISISSTQLSVKR